jgi:hypothetical protein
MKKNLAKILLGLAFLLAFNVIYYITGGIIRTASCWIAYAFIHLSYLLLIFFSIWTGREYYAVELTLPVLAISFIYFVANLVLGSIIIIISPLGIKLCVILEILMLAAYLIFICPTLLANQDTMEQIKRKQMEKHYVQDCSDDSNKSNN